MTNLFISKLCFDVILPLHNLKLDDWTSQLQQPADAAAVGPEEGGPVLWLHHPGGRQPSPSTQTSAGSLQHALQVVWAWDFKDDLAGDLFF